MYEEGIYSLRIEFGKAVYASGKDIAYYSYNKNYCRYYKYYRKRRFFLLLIFRLFALFLFCLTGCLFFRRFFTAVISAAAF